MAHRPLRKRGPTPKPPTPHLREHFSDAHVEVDNASFVECTFERCVLVYRGGVPPDFVECTFSSLRIDLADAAVNTVSFLRSIYGGFDEVGRRMVDDLIDDLRGDGQAPPPAP